MASAGCQVAVDAEKELGLHRRAGGAGTDAGASQVGDQLPVPLEGRGGDLYSRRRSVPNISGSSVFTVTGTPSRRSRSIGCSPSEPTTPSTTLEVGHMARVVP